MINSPAVYSEFVLDICGNIVQALVCNFVISTKRIICSLGMFTLLYK